MSELDELKKINAAEHESLQSKLNNIGMVNKILLGVLVAIFTVMLTVLLSINRYSEKAYNVRVETFKIIQKVVKETNQNIDWTHEIYNNEISKNTVRSKNNSKRLDKVERKIGVY
jgi:cell division protein FtsL